MSEVVMSKEIEEGYKMLDHAVEELAFELDKFYEDGVKLSAMKARKVLHRMATTCKEMRKVIQDDKVGRSRAVPKNKAGGVKKKAAKKKKSKASPAPAPGKGDVKKKRKAAAKPKGGKATKKSKKSRK